MKAVWLGMLPLFLIPVSGVVLADQDEQLADPGRLLAGGYVHAQWRSDLRPGKYPRHSFGLRRVRLKFRYVPSDVGANIELGCDGLTPVLREAYVRYRPLSWLGFVLGLHKMPFSLEELTSADQLLLAERSPMNDCFGNLGYLGRDVGLAIEGELTGSLRLGYTVGVFNGTGGKLAYDNNNAKQLCGRLTGSPTRGLTLGVGISQRHDSLTGSPLFALGGDARLRLGGAVMQAEILIGKEATGQSLSGALRLGAFEPVARLARVGEGGANVFELTAGGNWYLHRRLKLGANLVDEVREGSFLGPLLILQAQAGF